MSSWRPISVRRHQRNMVSLMGPIVSFLLGVHLFLPPISYFCVGKSEPIMMSDFIIFIFPSVNFLVFSRKIYAWTLLRWFDGKCTNFGSCLPGGPSLSADTRETWWAWWALLSPFCLVCTSFCLLSATSVLASRNPSWWVTLSSSFSPPWTFLSFLGKSMHELYWSGSMGNALTLIGHVFLDARGRSSKRRIVWIRLFCSYQFHKGNVVIEWRSLGTFLNCLVHLLESEYLDFQVNSSFVLFVGRELLLLVGGGNRSEHTISSRVYRSLPRVLEAG